MRHNRTTMHATLVSLQDRGLLLTGEPGVGKSSLALELIKDGFQLIADDITILLRQKDSIIGFSPKKTRGYLYCKKLINLTQSIGEFACKKKCEVHRICHIIKGNTPLQSPLEAPTIVNHQLLGTCRPELIISKQQCNSDILRAYLVNRWVV